MSNYSFKALLYTLPMNEYVSIVTLLVYAQFVFLVILLLQVWPS